MQENKSRAQTMKSFLPDERTSMITQGETKKILQRAFEYLVALMEFTLIISRFQVNYFLYEGFKTELSKSFTQKCSDANWKDLVQADPSIDGRLEQLRE